MVDWILNLSAPLFIIYINCNNIINLIEIIIREVFYKILQIFKFITMIKKFKN